MATVVELVGGTTTDAGLTVHATYNNTGYERGVKFTNAELAALLIHGAPTAGPIELHRHRAERALTRGAAYEAFRLGVHGGMRSILRGRDDHMTLPVLAGFGHRWIDVGDLRVHVAEGGAAELAAPIIVFLHGWPQNWWCWRKVLPPLASEAHLIAVDLRGHGWSGAPKRGYEKENLVDDLFGLLDELGHERVTLVGHDWGGWIAFLAALREPSRFNAMVALGIIHPFQRLSPQSLANAWRGAYQVLLALPLLGEGLLRSSPSSVDRAISVGCYDSDAVDPAVRRHYGELMQAPARARASVQMYRSFLLHDLAQLGRYRNQTLRVPTRLVVGRHDPVATKPFLDGWQDHAVDMTVEVLGEVGHFVPEEAPDHVVSLVRSVMHTA